MQFAQREFPMFTNAIRDGIFDSVTAGDVYRLRGGSVALGSLKNAKRVDHESAATPDRRLRARREDSAFRFPVAASRFRVNISSVSRRNLPHHTPHFLFTHSPAWRRLPPDAGWAGWGELGFARASEYEIFIMSLRLRERVETKSRKWGRGLLNRGAGGIIGDWAHFVFLNLNENRATPLDRHRGHRDNDDGKNDRQKIGLLLWSTFVFAW